MQLIIKKIILIVLASLFSNKVCFCQKTFLNRDASYKQYGQNIHYYLKSQHEFIYKGELDTIKEQFFFIVSFKIDVNGNVVEYETNKTENIPNVVINYIKRVIYLTSGSWQPEIKDCAIVKSDKILCRVHVYPKKYFLNSLNEYDSKWLTSEDFKFTYVSEINLNDPNTCFLDLSY